MGRGPYDEKTTKEVTSETCVTRKCGFSDGIFCGTCDMNVEEQIDIKTKDSPIFKIPSLLQEDLSYGIYFVSTYTNTPILALYVGSTRRLIRDGDSPFEGISLVGNKILQDDSYTGSHEILAHVLGTEASIDGTWVKFSNDEYASIGSKKGEVYFWRNIVVCLGALLTSTILC